MKFIGVDGCRGGWFLFGLDEQENRTFSLLRHIAELEAYLTAAERVLIDIPIGLLRYQSHERTCDKQARRLLGRPRGASVFAAPSRCALACKTYETANARNKACTGRGLSRQCYGILPKIREVDVYLEIRARRQKIHEMHPELCFWALNQQVAMANNKKTAEGNAERIAVLTRYYPQARDAMTMAMQQYSRSQLARDDIVDAMVGAVTAQQAKSLQRLPNIPEQDEKGLAMEIVY